MKIFTHSFYLILIGLIFTTSLNAQEEDKSKEKKEIKFADDDHRVFRIGFNFAPQLFFFNNPAIPDVESDYKAAFNMDASLVFTAKFGKVFEAKTGIGYSSKNFKRQEKCIICGNDITEENSFKLNYIELPLLANLYFYNSRLDAYGIIGIRNAFLVGGKNKYKANINNPTESVFNVKQDFAKYLLGIQAGMGINYNLTYAMSLTAEILYNYNPLILETATGLKYHSLGLNIGINFKI